LADSGDSSKDEVHANRIMIKTKKILYEHFRYRSEVLSLYNFASFIRDDLNPKGSVVSIPSRSGNLEIRPNFRMKWGSIAAGIKPRLSGELIFNNDNGYTDSTHDSLDFYVNEAFFRLKLPKAFTVSIMREGLLWGPGFIQSPSCPFYTKTLNTKPLSELSGKDFVSVSFWPSEWLNFSSYINFGRGNFQKSPFEGSYNKMYAFKANITHSRFFIESVLSADEKGEIFGGLNAKFVPVDEIITYLDFGINQKPDAYYPVSDRSNPLGFSFRQRESDEQCLTPEVLVGISYTFLTGAIVGIEYFYYGLGYNDQEANDYFELLNRSRTVLEKNDISEISPDLFQLARGNMFIAMNNSLSYLRKNYCILYFTKNEFLDRISIISGLIANIDDASGQGFGTFYVDLNEWSQVVVSGIVSSAIFRNHGISRDAEYNYFSKYSATIGLRFSF
jgi:hypothetical protein